jgi:hypothetical protein
VVKEHKTELSDTSTRALLTRRRRLAGQIGDVSGMLAGSLSEQTRRCGKPTCRCADGAGHGPYAYFRPRTPGRARYVPANLVAAVRTRLARGEQVEAALAEIAAINAELLARRELR